MVALDTIDIAAIAWIDFNYMVLCPTMLYFLYKFNKLDSEDPLVKFRNKTIILILNIMMMFTLLIERPLAAFVVIWDVGLDDDAWYYIVFGFAWWSAFFLFLVKVFFLFYKQKYSMAIADIAWAQHLDPNAGNNWYIVKKSSYGDPIYCVKLLTPFFLLSVALTAMTKVAFPEDHQVLAINFAQFAIAGIPVMLAFWIFYLSRTVADVYKLRNEAFLQCVCIMLALLQYFGCFLYFNLAAAWTVQTTFCESAGDCEEVTEPTDEGHRIEWLLRNLTANLCAIGLALIPTAYPVWLSKEKEKKSRTSDDVSNQIALNQVSQDITEMTDAENVYGETESMLAMKHVIAGYDSFKAFMQHLVSEFSTESLLFLVEYIQVKHTYQIQHDLKKGSLPVSPNPEPPSVAGADKSENVDDSEKAAVVATTSSSSMLVAASDEKEDGADEERVSSFLYGVDGQVLTKVCIPLDIPKSVILRNQKSLQGQMDALYHKYVKVNSDHELNLSAVNRKTLKKRFERRVTPGSAEKEAEDEKSAEEALLNCMDSAAMQILALLQDPFTRFKNTILWRNEFLQKA